MDTSFEMTIDQYQWCWEKHCENSPANNNFRPRSHYQRSANLANTERRQTEGQQIWTENVGKKFEPHEMEFWIISFPWFIPTFITWKKR